MNNRENKYFALLIRMKKECEDEVFDLDIFIKESRADASFITACEKMGFVEKVKKKWIWLIEDPTEADAKFIIELVNDFAKKRRGNMYDGFTEALASLNPNYKKLTLLK